MVRPTDLIHPSANDQAKNRYEIRRNPLRSFAPSWM